MTDNVFDQNTDTTTTQIAPPVSSDPFADKLKEIVNEQGQPKYENTAKALEALKASQEHIKRLEQEAQARSAEEQRLREAATKAEALEEIVQRLTNKNSQTPPSGTTPPNAGMSEDAIVKALEKIVENRSIMEQAKNNQINVQNALLAKFGETTKEMVAAKAKELGTTSQELGALSSKNPQMVLALFGLTGANTSPSPTTPSSTPLVPNTPQTSVQRPEKSLISGASATDKNRKELMKKIKEEVYKKYDVTT